MPKRTGDYDGWFIKKLTDPRIAADYINAAVREHPENIKVALGNVAKAHTVKKVAKDAGVARESLYTSLSDDGNPTLSNLNGILKSVGLRIAVVAEPQESGLKETKVETECQFRPSGDSALKAITGLTGASSAHVGIRSAVRLFGAEPHLAGADYNFIIQFSPGSRNFYPFAGSENALTFQDKVQKAIKDQAGIIDAYNAMLIPAQDARKISTPAVIGSLQLVR